MALASISVRGFRNLEPTSVTFAVDSNYLFGPNGAGKTNLLEAIHYLAIGRSFRRCPDGEMLGFGRDVLVVSGVDESGEAAEIRFDGREKRLLRNDIPVEKLSEYFGWLPVVVLLLEDIELVRGAPGVRRGFLDVAIAKAEGGPKSEARSQKPKAKTEEETKAEARSERLEARVAEAEKSEAKSQRPKAKTEEETHCPTGAAEANAEARSEKLEARAAEAEKSDVRCEMTDVRSGSEKQSHIALVGEYRRAVGQYNRLLERSAVSGGRSADEVAAWEEEVVRTGVPVYEARLARLGELLENAARHYERLAGHEVEFSYKASIVPTTSAGDPSQAKPGDSPWESQRALRRDSPRFCGTVPVFAGDIGGAFRRRLADTRERARALGHALVGPHRDDIRITRGDRDLRKFGSVGEQRLAGIALRLAEADMILASGRQRPVFLLDEVASELDEERSRTVLSMVAERGQMVYAAARRTVRLEVKGQDAKVKMQNVGPDRDQEIEGSSDELPDTARDAASAREHLSTGALEHFSGKEFHVQGGTVSEVS